MDSEVGSSCKIFTAKPDNIELVFDHIGGEEITAKFTITNVSPKPQRVEVFPNATEFFELDYPRVVSII